MTELKRYILLPREGFINEALRELDPVVRLIEPRSPFVLNSDLAEKREIRVIHSIMALGPKLVEMDDEAARNVDQNRDVCRLPVIMYGRPFIRPLTNRRPSEASGGVSSASYPYALYRPIIQKGQKVTIKVKVKKNGKKVSIGSGLLVTAFSDFFTNKGDEKVTDSSGKVIMQLSGNTIEHIYCEQLWKWGAFRQNIAISPSVDLEIEPLDENFTDCVRQYYGRSRFESATGVTVGVIDTGVGSHDDLNVVGGLNMADVIPNQDYHDVLGHGTFVAGLIGSRGNLFPKLRGLAPGVPIRAYKIFGGGKATNYALMCAIDRARKDKCDILNLSIENGPSDDVALQRAITEARNTGTLVVVAAGNDARGAVNYPAAYPGATAISAMGCEGTLPFGVIDEASIYRPPGNKDQKEFIAAFSNVGSQISATALGVGVLSTLPGNSFGSCSGTSMAAPVVSGAAACLLSQNPNIYNMPRNRARSDAIEQLLIANCVKRGFGPEYEGNGMPDPTKV